jgi:hypothetical protein
MTQTVTVHLSDTLYQQLQRAAELFETPTEVIVAQSLAHSLPPLLEDIPAPYQKDVYPLLQMDAEALQREARAVFPSDQWAEYEALLETKRERALSTEEQAHLDVLRRQADVLMFRRSYAAVLLKRRGHETPPLSELQPT